MKKAIKKLCLIMAAIMCIAILPCQVNAAEAKPTIHIVGDSMVADYEAYKYPRMGWGQAIKNFFNDEVEIINHAVAGTSSRSFYDTYWTDALAQIEEGDYLLFTFGANDSNSDKSDTGTGTDADISADEQYTTEEVDGVETKTYSFKWYMKKYITDVQTKNATPIILTPPERRDNRKTGDNYKFAIATMEDYTNAIIELANSLNEDEDDSNDIVCLDDVSEASLSLYTAMGDDADNPANSRKLFCYLADGQYTDDYWSEESKRNDGTHFRDFGATEIAGIIVEELIKNNSDLTQYLKVVSTPVIYDADHNTAGTAIKMTDKKVKGTTLYPRAQIINKENTDTTVQVIMAEYDSEGTLIDILSKDEFTVPAKSVESFDARYTMSNEEAHAGTIKMFVWKDYDSLLPLDSKLIKWDFTEEENSGVTILTLPVDAEDFDSYVEGATINDGEKWKTGAGTFTATATNGNIGMSCTATAKNQNTYIEFTKIKTQTAATEPMDTVVEFDLKDTEGFYINLRAGGKDLLSITTAQGKLKLAGNETGCDVNDGGIHHIKLVIDEAGYTADLYVDGSNTPAVENISLTDQGDSYYYINRFFVKANADESKLWIDNIEIYRQQIILN